MLIDTHCHLNFKAFDKDLKEIIAKANNIGVKIIIIPGAKIDSSKKAIKIASNNPSCFAAVGIHPHHVQEFIDKGDKKITDELSELIKEKKVVAIGEIGLDFHQYKEYPPISDKDKNLQKKLLLLQLNLAAKNNLPVIIHCRQAYDDLLSILTEFSKKHALIGVFHCFSGSIEHLTKILEMGFYIGLDGNITYPENRHITDLVRTASLKQLVLETDAPFLTPIPFRGTKNEPSFLPYIANYVSTIHKKSKLQISKITSDNALKLFRLEYPLC